jgi:O-antigen/teichoic acid export membrane protein
MFDFKKILKESGINFFSTIIGKSLKYLWLIVATAFLSPDTFGRFILGQSMVMILSTLSLFGTNRALHRFIPIYKSQNEEGKILTLIYKILTMVALVTFGILLVSYVVKGYLIKYFYQDSSLNDILNFLLIGVPVFSFIKIIGDVFVGFKKLGYRVLFEFLLLPSFNLVLTYFLLMRNYGLNGLVFAYITSLLLTSIISLSFFYRKIFEKYENEDLIEVDFKKVLKYSWPLSLTGIIFIFLSQIDYLFLGSLESISSVAPYKIYASIAIVLGMVLESFEKIYKPIISEYFSNGNFGKINELYLRVTHLVSSLNGLVFLILAIFGFEILGYIISDEYLVSKSSFVILLMGYYVGSLLGPDGANVEVFDHTKLRLLNTVIMLVVNIILNFLLIPLLGTKGAALATATSLSLGGILGVVEIYLFYEIRPFDFNTIKICGSMLITGVVFFVYKKFHFVTSLFHLLIAIILLSLVYLILLFSSGALKFEDFKWLKST